MNKRTKIVCTIGPSSNSPKVLTQMIKAGMNVARLNFSHGKHSDHLKIIKMIRQLSKKFDQPITIIQDLQGPRIRLGEIPGSGFVIQPKEEIILNTNPKAKFLKKDKNGLVNIPVTYNKMHLDIKKGERVLLVDGLLELVVIKINGREIKCKVENGGLISSNKGINLPQTKLSIPTITDKDKEDLEFGIKNNIDMVALSFVRSEKCIRDLKKKITQLEKKYKVKDFPTQIIVKIEKPEAVKNFSKILELTDGVMVARGDLGIEMPEEEVPIIQKEIIEKCLKVSKPVIVATQLMDSMIRHPKPTRAEVNDVANAVIDHTDAVMLSGETANGKYPVETVETMARIISRIENSKYDDLEFRQEFKEKLQMDEAISTSANLLAKNLRTKAILAATITGYTGRIISSYRPELPILVPTNSEKVRRQLNLSWGVIPFVIAKTDTIEGLLKRALSYIKRKKFVKAKDKIIITAGFPLGQSGTVNWIKIHQVK